MTFLALDAVAQPGRNCNQSEGDLLGGAEVQVSSRFHKDPASLSAPSDSINKPTQSPILSNFRTAKMAHTDSFNTKNSYNKVWNNCIITDDRSQLLSWLSPLDPKSRHQDIQDGRVENIGEWLLQTEEFRNWCAGSGGMNPITESCFAMEIRGSVKHIIGKKNLAIMEQKGKH